MSKRLGGIIGCECIVETYSKRTIEYTCTKSPGEKTKAIIYTNRNNMDMICLVGLRTYQVYSYGIKTWGIPCYADASCIAMSAGTTANVHEFNVHVPI